MRNPLGIMCCVIYSSKQITFQNIFNLLRNKFLLLTIRCESVRESVLAEVADPENMFLAIWAHLLSSEKNSIKKKKRGRKGEINHKMCDMLSLF
ncbi:hypothetical protein XELAEV_18000427mg [Xenopus laevis]|uniref:Uncharacterized protein n=1 Tax=Xenopus laevis TaxID=8355 RepID=A0A974BPC4_XENLA|nr:hypothetical protein XELAEV_18000427mg [Xenopus laevis]